MGEQILLIVIATFALASVGLQATPAGLLYTPRGASQSFIFIKHNHSVRRFAHTAWTPPSLPDSIVLLGGSWEAQKSTAEIVPGKKMYFSFYLFSPGGVTFSLPHKTSSACGIPDGETFVMTGAGESRSYVTRWEDAKS